MPEQLFLPPEYLNWPYTPDGVPTAPPPPPAPVNPFTDLAGGLLGDNADAEKANDRPDRPQTSSGGLGWGSSMLDTTGGLGFGLGLMGGMAAGPLGAAAPGAVASANNLDYINNTRRTLGLPEISTGDYISGMLPFGLGNDLGSGGDDTRIGDVSIGGKDYTVTPGGGVVDGKTTITPTEARRRQFWAGQTTAQIADIANGKPTSASTSSSDKPAVTTKSSKGGKKAAATAKSTKNSNEREANSDSQSSRGGKEVGKSGGSKGKGKGKK